MDSVGSRKKMSKR